MGQDQSKSGFTGMLLSLASIVSTTTEEVIKEALESIPTKKVFEWLKKNIGQSVQSRKKKVLSIVHQQEQKWDHKTATFGV